MTRTGTAALAAVAVLLAASGSREARAATAGTRRFALIVGNNTSPRADLARLRYADDDAVRWAVLLATMGATVEVLTELDAESRRLYGGAVPPLGPPSRAGVQAAAGRLAARIAEARARGEHTVFYFVYAGHGDVEGGKGSISLADGWFSRDDLGATVVGRAGADTSHVIVDACRASYLLGNRGPGGERRPWADAYFRPGEVRFPNTGFLLASSSSGLSHEWEEFQAGVFSHEVRSGLLGPADANGDGRITYRELIGFVRLANEPVRNDKFRPQIVSRPPAGGDDVLVDVRDAAAGVLALGPAPAATHQMLEDGAGVRWADFHPSGAGGVRVVLPRAGWGGPDFYLRSLASGTEYSVPAGRDVALADLAPRTPTLLRRGALHDAFTHLFELPFDELALDALPLEVDLRQEAGPGVPPGADLAHRPFVRRAAIGAAAVGVASLAVAGGLVVSAQALHASADGKSGSDRADINQGIATRNRWATTAGIAGAALTALGAGLIVWSR
jgi:hypothetical protein